MTKHWAPENLQGIEKVRRMRSLFSHCTESFNSRFSFEELGRIFDAYHTSGYDITPDRWSEEQVQGALKGVTPAFEDQ